MILLLYIYMRVFLGRSMLFVSAFVVSWARAEKRIQFNAVAVLSMSMTTRDRGEQNLIVLSYRQDYNNISFWFMLCCSSSRLRLALHNLWLVSHLFVHVYRRSTYWSPARTHRKWRRPTSSTRPFAAAFVAVGDHNLHICFMKSNQKICL